MTYVLLVLSDRHHHLGHRPAHPVREVPTPPQLGVSVNSVLTILSQTQLGHLHAKHVQQEWDLSHNPEGRFAKPVNQGGI